MTSDIKQSLNKHEIILERYKSLLFSDKNKPSSSKNTNNIRDPINEITHKTFKIKENINSGLNIKNINNESNLADTNLNKSEKKIDEILKKANFAVYANNNQKSQIATSNSITKTFSSSERLKKIVAENNKNKINEKREGSEKVKYFLYFYFKKMNYFYLFIIMWPGIVLLNL